MGAELSCSAANHEGSSLLPGHAIHEYSVSCLKKTYNSLLQKHFTSYKYVDPATMIQILPFDMSLSHVITHLFTNDKQQLNWRKCLGGLLLCVSGTVTEKLQLLFQIHNLWTKPIYKNSLESILTSLFTSAQKIYQADWEDGYTGLKTVSLNINVIVDDIIRSVYRDKDGSISAAHILSWAESHSISWNMSILGNDEDKNGLIVTSQSNAGLRSPGSSRKQHAYSWLSIAHRSSEQVPNHRYKHASCFHDGKIYIHGGKDGSITMKDLWQYDIATDTWSRLHCHGDVPGRLHEHTMLPYKDKLYVFGGQFGSSNETPLWILDLDEKIWTKHQINSEVMTPGGRRGHSAVVHGGAMHIFGGYVDLKGSSSELWTFDFEMGMWHLAYSLHTSDEGPGARHKHSAVVYDNSMWLFGGMTDLQPHSDLWKWSFRMRNWSKIRSKTSPPDLCGHSVCKLPDGMMIFGGESEGVLKGTMWKFHFGSQGWQRITCNTQMPSARTGHSTVVVSSIYLNPPEVDRSSSVPHLRSSTPTEPITLSRPYSSPAYLTTANNLEQFHLFKNRVSPIPSPSQTDWQALTNNFNDVDQAKAQSTDSGVKTVQYYKLTDDECDTNENIDSCSHTMARTVNPDFLRSTSTCSESADLLDSVMPMDKRKCMHRFSTSSDLGVDNPTFMPESNNGTEENLSSCETKWVDRITDLKTHQNESDNLVTCLRKSASDLDLHDTIQRNYKQADTEIVTDTHIPGMVENTGSVRKRSVSFDLLTDDFEKLCERRGTIIDNNDDDDDDEHLEVFGANNFSDLVIMDVHDTDFDRNISKSMRGVSFNHVNAEHGQPRLSTRENTKNAFSGSKLKSELAHNNEINCNKYKSEALYSFVNRSQHFDILNNSGLTEGCSEKRISKNHVSNQQRLKRQLPDLPTGGLPNNEKCDFKLADLLDRRKFRFYAGPSEKTPSSVPIPALAKHSSSVSIPPPAKHPSSGSNQPDISRNDRTNQKATLLTNEGDLSSTVKSQNKAKILQQMSLPAESRSNSQQSQGKNTKRVLPASSFCVFLFGGREKEAQNLYIKPMSVWRCDIIPGKAGNSQIQKLISESSHLQSK